MSQSEIIVIGEKQICRIEYQGEPVVTLAMVDELHGRPEGTARRTFAKHRGKLLEDVDYFVADDKCTFNVHYLSGRGSDPVLLTETGYLMLVKPFRDDLAWSIQRQLVNLYFKKRCDLPVEQEEHRLTAILEKLTANEAAIINTQAEHTTRLFRLERSHKRQGRHIRSIAHNVKQLKSIGDGRRKEFGRACAEVLACVVVERFCGRCPVCEVVRIAEHPWRPTEQMELHHWRMKGGNAWSVAFPCCKSCHAKLSADYTLHDTYESVFVMVQKWAQPGFKSNAK